jgi:hypothetical protein
VRPAKRFRGRLVFNEEEEEEVPPPQVNRYVFDEELQVNNKGFSISEQPLRRSVERFRGGLVFKAPILLHRSTLGARVIKKRTKRPERPHTLPVTTPETVSGVQFHPDEYL